MNELERQIVYADNIAAAPEEIIPKTMEEMGELTQALCKLMIAGSDVAEALPAVATELADVRIMTDQLAILIEKNYHGFTRAVEEEENRKLRRRKEILCAKQKHT